MSISPQLPANAGEQSSAAPRGGSILPGRQGYLPVTLRLIGMELYKLRRRALSKTLGSIAIALAIIPFLFFGAGTLVSQNAPLDSFQPPCQTFGNSGPGGASQPPAACPTLTPAELLSLRQSAVEATSTALRLPTSLNIVVEMAFVVGSVLIIVLIGTIVGGEFSIGTIRLLFTRGPTRSQFLIAKLGTMLIITFCGVTIMVILGVLAGQVLNPISGIAQNGDYFSADWFGHAILYTLAAMLGWLVYGTVALFFGIVGRSTVAGVVGAFLWLILELILSSVLGLIGSFSSGPFGNFLKAIPDYFIGNNISALLGDQAHYLFGSSPPALSALHALLVLACYLALFTGLAWWINKQRDITN
jgi:ABC-type transport system involved in multi-copper enzyme maturation permease subunit